MRFASRQPRQRRTLLNADYLARGALASSSARWRLRTLTRLGLLRLVAGWPPDPDHFDPGAYWQPGLLERLSALSARSPSEPPSGSRLMAAIAAMLRTSRSQQTTTGPSIPNAGRSAAAMPH